jgi:hypothetical protein
MYRNTPSLKFSVPPKPAFAFDNVTIPAPASGSVNPAKFSEITPVPVNAPPDTIAKSRPAPTFHV